MRVRAFVVAAALGTVTLTASAAGASALAAPTITSFSPTAGPVGTSVSVFGTNFVGVTSVTFNLVAASFIPNSSTQITAVVPAGATTGAITVTTPGGTAVSGAAFTVTAGVVPTITSFSPTSGPVGTSVSIFGTNFTGVTSVAFNFVAATSYAVNSPVQITATVPPGATTGPLRVTTSGGTATSAASFTVTGGGAPGNGVPLSASLRGSAEVPGPGDADGTGSASIRVNPGSRKLCFRITASGITLPAIAAHIHSGQAGVAGPVVVTLTPPGVSGSSSGCVTHQPRSLLIALIQHPSAYYVNVHTADFPGGAVRGQLGRGFAPTGQTTFSTSLRGSTEVPGPGDPDGRGTASVTLNPGAGTVCFTITVSGITLPATAAHIHQAPAGVAGAVVVTLSPPGVTGSVTGCVGGQSAALLDAIVANPSGYYVNVHTVDFPGGAVRGQLGQHGNHDGDDDDDQGEDENDD